jgi:DNA helicase-2/ATP-dependent DNA helicase PcrA
VVPREGILSLSPVKIDDYTTCPQKYKFVHILKIPVIVHHAVIYGSAIHEAVKGYYRQRQQTGQTLTLAELQEIFKKKWRNEGFISREHEEERFQQGLRALKNFYEFEKTRKIFPREIERGFRVLIDENLRLEGRWDRIDERDGKAVIVEYKAADVLDEAKASENARNNRQLLLYAYAYSKLYQKPPDWLELYYVGERIVIGRAVKQEKDLEKALNLIKEVAQGIRAQKFDPSPAYGVCETCAYKSICLREGDKEL